MNVRRSPNGLFLPDAGPKRQPKPDRFRCVKCDEWFDRPLTSRGYRSQAILCPRCRGQARTGNVNRRTWRQGTRLGDPGPLERGIEQRLAIRGYDDGWSGFAPAKRKEGA